MGWIGCVRRKKFKRNFMVRTCALIAPVQPILHRVLYSNEILPNTTKHFELHQRNEFRVQWRGSGAFVAKNSDATSWHEL